MAGTEAINSTDRTETWWLYVLECRRGILYTGIAKDVDARFAAHLNGTGAMFTRLNPPLRILARLTMPTKSAALRAEYAFKQASRADKLHWCATGLEGFVSRDRRNKLLPIGN